MFLEIAAASGNTTAYIIETAVEILISLII